MTGARPAPIHVPARRGFAALDELALVPWRNIRHIYGVGVLSDGLEHDVAGSLRHLAANPSAAIHALYSNICHQGTICEAAAYAAPFIASIAAGDIEEGLAFKLMLLLANLTMISAADEGWLDVQRAGDEVRELVRDAILCSHDHIEAIGSVHRGCVALAEATIALATHPSLEGLSELHSLMGDYAAIDLPDSRSSN